MIEDENDIPVNWVERKANCTIAIVFEQLCYQVGMDVTEANKMRPNKWEFETERSGVYPNENSVMTVRRESPRYVDGPRVLFVRERDSIQIHCHKGKKLQVTLEWNHETTTCDICLDGGPRKLWQISCNALWNLFFEF